MVSTLYKWLLCASLLLHVTPATFHPVYVSVTEIEHNAKDKTLEISCKVFTDDFEKTLRQQYKGIIDLTTPKDKSFINNVVNNYMQKHLQLAVDGKAVALQFVGYEQQEEGILVYYQVNNIANLKKLDITDNVLYDWKKEQTSVVHVTVNGARQSTKFANPEDRYSFKF